MKKHLFLSLAAIVLLAQHALHAQCNWTTVGTGAVSTATFITYSNIALTPAGDPYVIYADVTNSNKPTVKTYTAGAWQTVGTVPSYTNTSFDRICMNGNTPYIVFSDGSSGRKARVMSYTAGSWSAVGTGTISADTALYTSIAIDNSGTPYVAFSDKISGKKVVVKKYSAGSWVSVGAAVSTGTACYTSLAFDNTNTPYVAFQDLGQSNKAVVMKFNGSSWVAVGTGTVSSASGTYVNVAINPVTNAPYVSYVDPSPYSGNVKMYSAGSWQTVGSGSFTQVYQDLALAFDPAGTPYTTYYHLASYKANALKFDGTNWVQAGGADFSAGTPNSNWITVDQTGVPYVAYNDGSAGVYVKKLSAGTTYTMQPVHQTLCTNFNGMLSAGTTTTGAAYQWQLSTTGNTGPYSNVTNGTSYTGATTTSLTIVAPTATLSNYYFRCVTNDGCINLVSDTASLIVYATPAVTSSSTTICLGQVATVSATGATTYSWSNGVTTASMSASPSINSTYTVIGTSNGCTATAYSSVIVNPLPSVSPGNNGPLCAGATLQLNDGGSGGSVYSWSGPGSYSSTLHFPTIASTTPTMSGTYTLTSINSYGCSSTSTTAVTINPSPTLTVTSNPVNLCPGGTATLTATGATTYSWNTAQTTPSISVTPTVTTAYTVTGTNTFSCTATSTIAVNLLASKTLSGTVASTIGAVSGNVILYKYSPTLSKWDSVTFTPFSSIYSFGVIDSATYVVKAVPTATNVQITYATSAISWQGATIISHGCTNNTLQHIQVQPYTLLPAGSGMMGGTITEGVGYVHKTANIETPGNPIPGIVVKGGKNPGAAIFGQTTTDASGHYAFSNVPDNTAGESYFILVDIPGLDTNQTYHKILSTGNNTFSNLDFTVDSMYVTPVMTTSLNELNKADYLIHAFPNPAQDQCTLEYSLLKDEPVSIALYDITGHLVASIQAMGMQNAGDHKIHADLSALCSGAYFIRIGVSGRESTLKLFISR